MNSRNSRLIKIYSLTAIVLLTSFTLINMTRNKPTVYLIGDSTVKNGSGKGADGLWGWGNFLADHFDTNKVVIRNFALGGRSSRTFITGGNWEKVLNQLQKGDYVIMQFGHNDGSPLDDSARARGTIRGVGNESKEIYNPILKKKEIVYTYGWYMRQYISETRGKGAISIICSPVPRNSFKDGRVVVAEESYALWAKQVADSTKTFYIPLGQMIAQKYNEWGQAKVATLFPKDNTHTNLGGAKINAECVAKGIQQLKKCTLRKYLLHRTFF